MSIHHTAIVSPDARLGPNVSVGPYAVIEAGTRIGASTEIRAHAVVKRFTTIGEGNLIHESAVIGGEPQDVAFRPCESFLTIGARNRIREGVTIHRGTKAGSTTVVGSDCFIMANAHVAHDCVVADGVIIANNVALAGHVSIGDHAFLSGGVVVHQFCRIGRLAMVGGNSKIVQDCLPFVITDGVPGVASGLNVVGLRRAGVSVVELRALKEGYRILLRAGLPLDEALKQLENRAEELVLHLVEFARSSTRGFCRC
jgi:UDP-N-acetylglucosamine acyltransferase